MQEKETIDFLHNEEISPQIDPSYLSFPIPSAKDLYDKIITRTSYELVTSLSLDVIQSALDKEQCNISFEVITTESLPNSLTHYTFNFKHTEFESNEEAFCLRKKCITLFNTLRHEVFSQDGLFLDDTDLFFHFADNDKYAFVPTNKKSVLSNAYRALCIYDLIVEELYLHNLQRKDSDYKNSLISDYLSLHSIELDGLSNHYRLDVSKKLQHYLKFTTSDKKAAALLKASFQRATRAIEFDRGVMDFIPLTCDAYEREVPQLNNGLNNYSHSYCSLIQYRYLLDLQRLCVSLTHEKTDVPVELKRVENQMVKWRDFKNQPIIIKYERLLDKINAMRKTNQTYDVGSWTSCYWEEKNTVIGEQIEKKLYINALNTRVANRFFPRSFANAFQTEMKQVSNNTLRFTRENHYGHNEGYLLSAKQEDIAKCPLSNLLIYSEEGICYLKDTHLVPLLFSKNTFFETKKPWEWVTCLKNKDMCTDDLKRFIWQEAIWPKFNALQKQDEFTQDYFLPIDILGVIISYFIALLEQENIIFEQNERLRNRWW